MTFKATKTSAFITGMATVFLLFLVENLVAPISASYPIGPAHLILMFAFLIAATLFVFGVDALQTAWQQFRQQGLFPDWEEQMALLRDIMPRFVSLIVGALLMIGGIQIYFLVGLN